MRDMHPAEALAVASEACDTWEPVECTCSRVRHTRRRKADWMDPSKGRVEGVVVFHRAESAPFSAREKIATETKLLDVCSSQRGGVPRPHSKPT